MNIEQQILIFDGKKEYLLKLQEELTKAKYKVLAVNEITELEKILRVDKYPVLLLCIDKNSEENFNLFKTIRNTYPYMEIIIMARRGDMKSAFNSLMLGACNYLTKNDSFKDLLLVIDVALKKVLKKLKKTPQPVWTTEGSSVGPLPVMIGSHPKILKITDLIKRAAATNLFVLITGETGAGKELVAQTVHHYSARKDKPFISFNCAAIPDTLLESEIFGHEKGAFTDAGTFKPGLLEQADKGTIFIDEIGEASPVFQAKLLRAIETGKFRRLGGTDEIKVDVRVVSATNNDIHTRVKNKDFRADLYFRLAGVNVHIPPLKERKSDIALLSNHFMEILNYSSTMKKKFSEATLHILTDYDWPGNVRQLKNCVERLAAFSDGQIIRPSDIDSANCFPDLLINATDMEGMIHSYVDKEKADKKGEKIELPKAQKQSQTA